MENASKALIIAGAILISILIISFGVIILGQGSDVINNANMSDTEITAFNGKFEAYEGTSVRGSNVKQLMRTVAAHNRTQDGADKRVQVVGLSSSSTIPTTYSAVADNANSVITKSDGSDGTAANQVSTSNFYEVKCVYTSTGLVKIVYVKSK